MDSWAVWLGLVLLLIVIAAAVWFLLRRPTGPGTAESADRGVADTTSREPRGYEEVPEPGAGEAHIAGLPADETGHGSPGGGTAGVVGAGAGDSSAGHGSPGAGTADMVQAEGYGAPGPGTADVTGAGSAGPEAAGTAAPGYGGAAEAPYDQVAEDAAYGTTAGAEAGYADTGYTDTGHVDSGYADTATEYPGTGGQRPVEPAATGEHWTPPGADVGDSAPGAPVTEGYETGTGYTAEVADTTVTGDEYSGAEPADGSYEVPAGEAYTSEVPGYTAREEAYASGEGYSDEGPVGTAEAVDDVPPEAYPGGGSTTTEETGAPTAWDSGTTAEPTEQPAPGDTGVSAEDEQRWEDTHAGPAGAAAAAGGAVAGASLADQTPSAEEVEAGEAYPGPMDDTSAQAQTGEQATAEQVGLAAEGGPDADAAVTGAAAAAAADTSGYQQDSLLGEERAEGGGDRDAGDYGYDEAHYGATSAGGYAPGAYGPSSATPADDGSGPAGWTVKGNAGSMLFHTPDSPSYEQMRAEVWFESEDAARSAGFAHWDRKQR